MANRFIQPKHQPVTPEFRQGFQAALDGKDRGPADSHEWYDGWDTGYAHHTNYIAPAQAAVAKETSDAGTNSKKAK